MSFQQKVVIEQAIGVEGGYAAINPVVTHPGGKMAEVDLPIGRFCWQGSEPDTVTNIGTGKPLGFVVREQTYAITDYRDEAQNFVPEGCNVSVSLKGDFFVKTATASTIGQKVFASLTDGSITTDDAGTAVAGYEETDYFVVTEGDADDIILISNWMS